MSSQEKPSQYIQKSKRAVNKKKFNDEFAKHQNVQPFRWQDDATKNYQSQIQPKLFKESIIQEQQESDDIEQQQEQQQWKESFNISELEQVNSILNNNININPIQKNAIKKIPLSTQERILKQRIQDNLASQQNNQLNNEAFRSGDSIAASSYPKKSQTLPQSNVTLNQQTDQKSLIQKVTKDFSSISSKPSSYLELKNQKNQLTNHLKNINLPRAQGQQIPQASLNIRKKKIETKLDEKIEDLSQFSNKKQSTIQSKRNSQNNVQEIQNPFQNEYKTPNQHIGSKIVEQIQDLKQKQNLEQNRNTHSPKQYQEDFFQFDFKQISNDTNKNQDNFFNFFDDDNHILGQQNQNQQQQQQQQYNFFQYQPTPQQTKAQYSMNNYSIPSSSMPLSFSQNQQQQRQQNQQQYYDQQQQQQYNLNQQQTQYNYNQSKIINQEQKSQYLPTIQQQQQNHQQFQNKQNDILNKKDQYFSISKKQTDIQQDKKCYDNNMSLKDRSRKRTEKQRKNMKNQKDKDENEVDRKQIEQERLPETTRMRSMKDIQSGSMRTSYALSKKSFKWSSKAKNIVQSGRSLKKDDEMISQEFQFGSSKQKYIKDSSDDSMGLEENVGDLQTIIPRYVIGGLVSQKITEQKGLKYKEKQRQKKLQKSQDQDKNVLRSQLDGWKALESFYLMLKKGNHQDIITSAETFGQAMTLFIENQQHFTHIITSDSFVFHSNIGEGSFGQVDLYFFKQYSIPQQFNVQDSQYSQDTWHSSCVGLQSMPIQQQQQSLFQSNQSQNIGSSLSMKDKFNMIFSSGQVQYADNLLENKDSYQLSKTQSYQLPYLLESLNNNQMSTTNQQQIQNKDLQLHIFQKEQSQTFDIFSKEQNNNLNQVQFPEFQYLPVACKKIENLEEFSRELFIMQTVKCEYMPKLIHQDLDKQLLFMELGLCSLEDLKNDSEENQYTFSDEFTSQILINLIKAIESLLQNVNSDTYLPQPLFHSDIKPSNVMLTVKKYTNQLSCSIKLLLIDYGGASFALEDYWTFYTPAFVSENLWQKLVDNAKYSTYLSWSEVRYAELYAACRSVQFLIVPDEKKEHFKKENYQLFLQQYSYLYPKTCYILRQVYSKETIGFIENIYDNIISPSDKIQYTGLNPQNIPFECKKIFELSKFYNCTGNDKKESPEESIQNEIDNIDINSNNNNNNNINYSIKNMVVAPQVF